MSEHPFLVSPATSHKFKPNGTGNPWVVRPQLSHGSIPGLTPKHPQQPTRHLAQKKKGKLAMPRRLRRRRRLTLI
nr:Purkinje cell protein 4-like protein 1 isoform X1 [Camelus dromedarius]